jgi:LPS-assembly lipoprotein
LVATALLGGCGFHPMLATRSDQSSVSDKSSVSDELTSIKVNQIEGRSGQVLRNDLVTALTPRGEPSRPNYTLIMRIEEPQRNLAFQRNNSVSFVGYSMVAYWTLLDKNGASVLSTASSSTLNYALSNSQYATAVSADNTRDLVALDIAQDIRNKLAQYFNAAKATPAAAKPASAAAQH